MVISLPSGPGFVPKFSASSRLIVLGPRFLRRHFLREVDCIIYYKLSRFLENQNIARLSPLILQIHSKSHTDAPPPNVTNDGWAVVGSGFSSSLQTSIPKPALPSAAPIPPSQSNVDNCYGDVVENCYGCLEYVPPPATTIDDYTYYRRLLTVFPVIPFPPHCFRILKPLHHREMPSSLHHTPSPSPYCQLYS